MFYFFPNGNSTHFILILFIIQVRCQFCTTSVQANKLKFHECAAHSAEAYDSYGIELKASLSEVYEKLCQRLREVVPALPLLRFTECGNLLIVHLVFEPVQDIGDMLDNAERGTLLLSFQNMIY